MATTRREREVSVVSLAGAAVEPLLALFADIAIQEGWQPGEQLHCPPVNSLYWAAYVDGELAGGLQVSLSDSTSAFPFRQVWPEVEIADPRAVLHVAILAVRPGYRGVLRLFWPLCVEMWRLCVLQDIRHIVIEATPSMLARYRRIGFDLEVIGELRAHWGEACFLCRADVHFVAGTMLMRALRSSMYRTLVSEAMRPAGKAHCSAAYALP